MRPMRLELKPATTIVKSSVTIYSFWLILPTRSWLLISVRDESLRTRRGSSTESLENPEDLRRLDDAGIESRPTVSSSSSVSEIDSLSLSLSSLTASSSGHSAVS